MNTEKYIRKQFEVQAVQVTEENLESVAKWCNGTIETEGDLPGTKRFIRVNVKHPLNARQTRAYLGDWVLKAETGGFKIYNQVAFEKSFERAVVQGQVHPNQAELNLL